MAEGGYDYSLEFLMECGICFEDFSLEGDHVPRILPCSHTLCEMCIGNILERKPDDANIFECPVCKVKHPVSKGARTFPQNQFILPIIRKKMIIYKAGSEEICRKHGRVVTLFCNDPECQENICNICMFEEHRNHNFVDLPELQEMRHNVSVGNVDTLKKTLKSLKEDLKSNKQRFVDKKQEINEHLYDDERQIEFQKNTKITEVTKIISGIYDDMLESIKAQKAAEFEHIDEDVECIEEFCDEIESMEDRIDLKSIAHERENFKHCLARISDVRRAGLRSYIQVTCATNEVECDKVKELCSILEKNQWYMGYLESFSTYRLMSACQLNDTGKKH